jgi:hypothetical protein
VRNPSQAIEGVKAETCSAAILNTQLVEQAADGAS